MNRPYKTYCFRQTVASILHQTPNTKYLNTKLLYIHYEDLVPNVSPLSTFFASAVYKFEGCRGGDANEYGFNKRESQKNTGKGQDYSWKA